MTIETYFEQFIGDTRHFNVHRDSRIEALLIEAGCVIDASGRVSYSMDSRGVVHVASYIHRPDHMREMLQALPLKYGIYDISEGHTNQRNYGDKGVTHFIEFRTTVSDRLRWEYDE